MRVFGTGCTAGAAMGLALVMAGVASGEVQWRSLPIRSRVEFERGLPGGESEQHWQGIARARSRPDRIYLSHDVGQVWRSDDNGRSWRHTGGSGLHVVAGQSVAADPVNSDTVLHIASRAWDHLAHDVQGLYRSEDAGATWTRVLAVAEVPHVRAVQHAIAWDPSSLTAREARRWVAAFSAPDERARPDVPRESTVHRSDDGGRTWRQVGILAEPHRAVYGVVVPPRRPDILFLHSERGLFMSEDGGASFASRGDLPAGAVRSLDIDPGDPDDLFATVDGEGLFRSRDGGRTFQRLRAFDARRVAVHPGDRNVLYLLGGPGTQVQVSRDGGAAWHEPQVIPLPGWGREESAWKTRIAGAFSDLVPDPRDPDLAVGFGQATLYRTTDRGRTFTDASAGFTGYAWGWFTRPVAFDRADPRRFVFFCYDVGAVITENAGDWFEARSVPWAWKRDGRIEHTGMYAGDFQPVPGSRVLVATAGMYWNQVLVRSEDDGRTWQIVDETPAHNLFVAFHEEDPDVVYANDRRSDDAGRTFRRLPGLPDGAAIVGMARSRPDTVYAMNRARTEILRSDDRGETWRRWTAPGWRFMRMDSKPTFLVCPRDADRVYTLDRRGDLAAFDGTAWRSLGVLDRAGSAGPPNFVRAVAVDPRDARILYAGLHAAGGPVLFRSTDGGGTWADITGDLPRTGIGGLVVHPHTGEVFTGGVTGTRVLPPPDAAGR